MDLGQADDWDLVGGVDKIYEIRTVSSIWRISWDLEHLVGLGQCRGIRIRLGILESAVKLK